MAEGVGFPFPYLTVVVFCLQFDLLCGQSVRRQLDFGKPDETANFSAAFEFGYFFLMKTKVLCQIFRVLLQVLFLVRPFGFSLFDFFPKSAKHLYLPPFGKGLPKKSFS